MDPEPYGLRLLGELRSRDRLLSAAATVDRLRAQGVAPEPAARFAELLATAGRALPNGTAAIALVVPGRIEVFGKHTDYCGGRSLLAAVELGIAIVAAPRSDGRIHVHDATRGDSNEFEFSPDLTPTVGHWSNYPMTVARRLARNFPGEVCGANIAMASNLPLAAGMSSSSALVTGIFLALAAINRLDQRPIWRELLTSREQLAGYCGCIENGQSFGPLLGDRGVGTFGGSQDHVAILCSEPGKLVQYSFCPIRQEAVVPMPAGYTFVIMDSGVIAEKTGAALEKYNAVSRRAAEALRFLNDSQGRSDTTLSAAIEHDSPRVWGRSVGHPETTLIMSRAVQLKLEQMNVRGAALALRMGDSREFGVTAARSQFAAEEYLLNQVPETIELVKLAKAAGAIAASSFGAGFGGSVWAMVETDCAAEFAEQWMRRYAEFGGHGRAFITGAGTPVVWV